MRMIPLCGEKGAGKFAIVDDEDCKKVIAHRWYLDDDGYARTVVRKDGKYETILMHRLIAGAKPGEWIDHRDLNTLNNQKSNLRRCTRSQNGANRKAPKSNTSGFKGVAWLKREKCFLTLVHKEGKQVYRGYFRTFEQAVEAYKINAVKHHGEFARW